MDMMDFVNSISKDIIYEIYACIMFYKQFMLLFIINVYIFLFYRNILNI